MKRKIILGLAILTMFTTPISVLAQNTNSEVTVIKREVNSAEFKGDNSLYSENKLVNPFSSYNLTSYKSLSSRNCQCAYKNGKDFQTSGWVNIVDKKSKTGLRHSTTAVVANYNDPQSYKGAVRVVGSGKVWATSEWVHGWSLDKIFWDWVN